MALSLVLASRSASFSVRVVRPVYPKFKFLAWCCARILYRLSNNLDYLNNKRRTSQEGTPGTRFSKKIYIAHTHHFVAPLCVVKGEKQSFGGKVRPHPVGVQSSSTRMISTSSVILLLQVCPTNYLSLAMIRTVPLDVSRTIRSRNHSIKR